MCLVLVLPIAAQLGCRGPVSTVQFVSYKDAYFPETYRVVLPGCAYWIDAGHDIHVVGRADRPDSDGKGPVRQYLHVCIYWKPHPGKTHADSSTSDALLRYVVAGDNGVAVYTGTGFAFPKEQRGGRLEVDIESARLRLESLSGDLPDVLGDAHVTGKLIVDKDPGKAAQLIRESELLAAH